MRTCLITSSSPPGHVAWFGLLITQLPGSPQSRQQEPRKPQAPTPGPCAHLTLSRWLPSGEGLRTGARQERGSWVSRLRERPAGATRPLIRAGHEAPQAWAHPRTPPTLCHSSPSLFQTPLSPAFSKAPVLPRVLPVTPTSPVPCSVWTVGRTDFTRPDGFLPAQSSAYGWVWVPGNACLHRSPSDGIWRWGLGEVVRS